MSPHTFVPCVLALAAPLSAQLAVYWQDGKAEMCRYELEVRCDGELRQGYAVLVFVTEDFRRGKQGTDASGRHDDVVSVFRLNRLERFTTGIEDLSMMSSVFTVMDVQGATMPPTLETTTSIQGWDGHAWQQTTLRDDIVEVEGHSGLQGEGQDRFTLVPALLEDEILSQVRLAPRRLPRGEVKVIPSGMRTRPDRRPPAVVTATASLAEVPRSPTDDVPQDEYRLVFDEGEGVTRTLSVRFCKGYPFHITRFEETRQLGEETTLLRRAVLQRTIKAALGSHRARTDDALRADFGLGPAK